MKEIERKRIKEELNDLVAKRFAKVMVEKINIVGTVEQQIRTDVKRKFNELIEVVNSLKKDAKENN